MLTPGVCNGDTDEDDENGSEIWFAGVQGGGTWACSS